LVEEADLVQVVMEVVRLRDIDVAPVMDLGKPESNRAK
jgi:hypothetical protein